MILTRRTRLDARRHPDQARPALVAKSTKRRVVTFNVRDESDSDGATVRAEPSRRREQQNLPSQSELPQSPPIVHQTKQSGNKKGELHTFIYFE